MAKKEDKLKEMTLIVQGSLKVIIRMAGIGIMNIDWGDNSSSEKYILSSIDDSKDWMSEINHHKYSHKYKDNNIYVITISGKKITHLFCENFKLTFKLTSLDISKNNELTHLLCNGYLKKLNVTQNIALKYLLCSYNKLTHLNLSKNTKLEYLQCDENNLKKLDVRKNTKLEFLSCSDNRLTKLDLSNNIALEYLSCNMNRLTNLISKNPTLKYLYCDGNDLANLDVSKNAKLRYFDCNMNNLIDLDIAKNTQLKRLECNSNQLTKLDVSNNVVLKELSCENNQLTDLDLSKNTKLKVLSCNYNELIDIYLSNNTELEINDQWQWTRSSGTYPQIDLHYMTESEWNSIFEMIPQLESIEQIDPTDQYVEYQLASVQLIGRISKILKPFDWAHWEEGISVLKEQTYSKLDLQTTCKLLTILLFYKESTEKLSPNVIPCQAQDLEDGRVLKLLKQLQINIEQKREKESKAQKMQREMAESFASPYYKELVSNKVVRDAHWMRVNGKVVPPSIKKK